jgi:YVTN family beta-propeller protein
VGALGTDRRIGSELAGYRIEALVGRGGMGVVFRAYDLALERPVALKILAPELAEDERFRERFLRESRLAASIDHPNIVPVYDAGEVAGELYIAMRYVEGSELKQLLAAGPQPKEQAVAIAGQIAAALDAAHARGLVHRDVKPSNALVTADGHVYLADFGLTRRLSDQADGFDAGLSLGTPAYVAPEQIEGKEVDGRADQYSLGCLLHECLTGAPPFPRPSEAAVLYAHLEEPPPASPGLESVMARALAKTPGDRYPTCSELVTDARSALGIASPARNRWPLAVAGLGLAVIAAALLAFFLTRGGGGPATTGTVVRLDAATGKVTGSVAAGNDPEAIAAGPEGVWVANFTDGTVSKIDPGGSQAATIRVNGLPVSLAVHGGVVLVATAPPANALTLIRAQAGSVYDLIPLHAAAAAATSLVEAGPAGIWVADKEQWTVRRVDPAGGTDFRVLAAERLPLRDGEINGLAVDGNAVWVVGNYLDRRLWRLDPRTARVVATIPLPVAPRRVAVGEGAVWVTGEIENVVLRVDPRENRVVARIPVGRGGSGIAAAGGSVWVANELDGTVSRIDPRTNRVVATIPVGGSPHDLVVSGGSVWLAGGRQ